mgnify:CR=1 FL=1
MSIDEDYWDYDFTVLTEDSLLFKADNIVMSNIKMIKLKNIYFI